jgi:ABC-2 type transport system ATP-binding protein
MNNGNRPTIQVRHLYKKFGSFTANEDLNFDVFPGEIFGFLGANGAGKTTAIKILCGLSYPTSGDVEVAGLNIYKEKERIKQNIGYMSQKFSLYNDLTARENIKMYGGIYGLSRKEIAVRTDELVDRLSFKDMADLKIESIPLGWRQKLAFSVAIFHKPSIVFLDEPTGGVDPLTRRQFWEMIYEASASGMTVFVTTHYMDEAEYCDRISIMDQGRIEAIGSPTKLKSMFQKKSINDVFVNLIRSRE